MTSGLSNKNQSQIEVNKIKKSQDEVVKKEKTIKFKTEDEVLNTNESSKFNKTNMIVVIRKRPLSKIEEETNPNSILLISKPNQVTLLDTDSVLNNKKGSIYNKHQNYFFDYAFDDDSNQEEVYTNTTKSLLPDLLDGFNSVILAYGATGCGKTHTMVGTSDNEGLMVRSVGDLFLLKEKSESEGMEIKIIISYVEVYNENIYDLLVDDKSKSEPLELYEDSSKSIIINGVTTKIVNQSNEVFNLLSIANKNRSENTTEANITSSRSHAILTIVVEKRPNTVNSGIKSCIGKFVLVDLAGSEKASYNKQSGQRVLEGANINKSLLALSNCMSALVDKKSFIPWRNSKLTRILQDSIGGNSRIVLIANVSPSILSYEETSFTLKYANRVKNIKKEVKQNFLVSEMEIRQYESIINQIQEEIEETKGKIKEKQSSNFLMTQKNFELNNEVVDLLEEVQNKINSHFQQEILLKKEISAIEKQIESIKLTISEGYIKLSYNNEDIKQASSISSKEDEKVILSNKLSGLYEKQSFLIKNRSLLLKEISKFINKEVSYKLINNYYLYYITLLDNMTLMNKEFKSKSTQNIQEIQIKELFNQLKIRDEMINKLNFEFKKRNILYSLSSCGVREYNEFSKEPFTLPQITSKYNYSEKSIGEKNKVQFNSNSQSYQLDLPNINPIKKPKEMRSFKYELSLKKSHEKLNKPIKLDSEKYSMKLLETIKSGMNLSINKSFSKSSRKSNYFQENDDTERRDNNIRSNNNFEFYDAQRNRMVKNLIRRDVIGRYRGSPYLKSP